MSTRARLPLAGPPRERRPALVLAVAFAVLALGATLFVPSEARAGNPDERSPQPSAAVAPDAPWPASLLDRVAYVAVQDGGRVMPLQSYAGFFLLRLNHRRSCKDETGRALDPLEFLLDAWFRPATARRCDCFLVDTFEVLDALGLERLEKKQKRDHYSYADFLPVRARLETLAKQYMDISSHDRTPVEGGVIDLYGSVHAFEEMTSLFDFARTSLQVDTSPRLVALFGGAARVPAPDVLGKGAALREVAGLTDPHQDLDDPKPDPSATPDQNAARVLLRTTRDLAESATGLAMVPPPGPRDAEPRWWTPGDLVYGASQGVALPPDHAAMLSALTGMGAAGGDASRIAPEVERFVNLSSSVARRRGEEADISLEVFLYRLDPFYRGVWLYVFAFLVLAFSWLKASRWLTRGAWVLLLGALALQVTGIVIRCVLRAHPPISNLYETCLFISALGAAACLVAEKVNGRGIALAMAPVVGGLGLFIADKLEAMNGEDTMRPLEAVLDTNFWLATHVTCINIGYAGGLLAAALAHVTVLGRTFGIKRGSTDFYPTLAKMTYGMLCFGLFFSVVGTILGGIWANESWGRFWGWDPKENGALMICLAQLAILHARMGGFLKTFGFAMASIGAGGVVAFSWWGVNLLGIGLHSYGFTSGILTGLLTFGGVEAAVLLAGTVTFLRGRAYGAPPAPAPLPPAAAAGTA